jgi:CRP/FNR family transcriptional regulator, nitrogen oxide reductase regulator
VASRLDRTLIADFDAFQGLTGEDLDDVLEHARPRRYEKNATVFQQGATADAFFVLLDGRLKVVQTTVEGQQVVIRFVNPGELFGIAAAIGRHDYPASAIAAADSVALAWEQSYWPALVARHPSVVSNTLRTVGGRLGEQQTRVREISTQRVERRIAHALLRLVRQAGTKIERGIEIAFPVTRQDLAEMTGTTLFTVSRVMSAWDQGGIIASGRQHIVVLDPHALVRIAEDAAERPAAGP